MTISAELAEVGHLKPTRFLYVDKAPQKLQTEGRRINTSQRQDNLQLPQRSQQESIHNH